ncbi:hypothetical protein [Limnohabitans sp.]
MNTELRVTTGRAPNNWAWPMTELTDAHAQGPASAASAETPVRLG